MIDEVTYPGANKCPNCNGTGVISYKWKVSVTLENGELPINYYSIPSQQWAYETSQEDMLSAKYKQVVE